MSYIVTDRAGNEVGRGAGVATNFEETNKPHLVGHFSKVVPAEEDDFEQDRVLIYVNGVGRTDLPEDWGLTITEVPDAEPAE